MSTVSTENHVSKISDKNQPSYATMHLESVLSPSH